jgi:hypothetical protein
LQTFSNHANQIHYIISNFNHFYLSLKIKLSSNSQESCNLINNYKCEIDPSVFIRNCKYDLCLDSNSHFQDEYLCLAMATYSYECAKVGSDVNWLSDPRFSQACKNSNHAQCPTGLVYSDCTIGYIKSCRNLNLFRDFRNYTECVQGKLIFFYKVRDFKPYTLSCLSFV